MTVCKECGTEHQTEPSSTDRLIECEKCQAPIWIPSVHTDSRPMPASKDLWLSLVCSFGAVVSLLMCIGMWGRETFTASAVYFGTLMLLVTGAYIRKVLRSLSQQLDHIARKQSELGDDS